MTIAKKLVIASFPALWLSLLGAGGLGTSAVAEAAEDGPKKTIMCEWFAYGETKFMCIKGTMKEAQKQCAKVASKMRGEPVECACTDDPNYIRDVCG